MLSTESDFIYTTVYELYDATAVQAALPSRTQTVSVRVYVSQAGEGRSVEREILNRNSTNQTEKYRSMRDQCRAQYNSIVETRARHLTHKSAALRSHVMKKIKLTLLALWTVRTYTTVMTINSYSKDYSSIGLSLCP